jgi:hypothetical protein
MVSRPDTGPLHGLGDIDHDEVSHVVRGSRALREFVERGAFSDDCAQQVVLCEVFAGIEQWCELPKAFGWIVGWWRGHALPEVEKHRFCLKAGVEKTIRLTTLAKVVLLPILVYTRQNTLEVS